MMIPPRRRSRPALPIALAIAAACAGAGCTHSVHQYTVGDYAGELRAPAARAVMAEATTKDWFFSTNNDFADVAYERLLAQCPGGEVQGIHTRHSTSHGFLSYTRKLILRGWCVGGGTGGPTGG